jgi:ubiquinone/menaquinone biosynthesis C-methylase UbiE
MPFEDNSFDAAFHSLVLHWTSDPRQVICEAVRVLKPGGLVFGTQATKPQMNPYFDIVIKTNRNSSGFFWQEEFRRWYAEQGVRLEIATPVGTFRGHKPAES